MSPEQAVCEKLDGRSDVYSLGAIMYELLCGQPPFEGKSFGDFVLQHKNRPPKPPAETKRGGSLPAPLVAVVLKCLAKQPADRYQTVAALKKDLLEVLEPSRSISISVDIVEEQEATAEYSERSCMTDPSSGIWISPSATAMPSAVQPLDRSIDSCVCSVQTVCPRDFASWIVWMVSSGVLVCT